ncbi:MAG: hypothetical protein RDA78_15405 [Roseibium sp.]|uniref:hypothetical protein n=1 Tax=Roseibium sp. TaxID=1936156 RepID=UPI003D9C242B
MSHKHPLEAGRGFSARVDRSAEAVGQHWGYLHLREIGYQAPIDMIDDDRVWRPAGLTDLNLEIREKGLKGAQLSPETSPELISSST